jgi:hypothetical protein
MFAAPSTRGNLCKRSATLRISDLQAFFRLFCAALVRAHSYGSPKLCGPSARRNSSGAAV